MTKLLITGAGGMLGANLVLDALAAGYQVVAADYEHPVRQAGVESVVADLSRPGTAQEVFVARRPDWVIHCAAATNVDACEADPATAFRLNRDMAGQVAMAAQVVGAQLVHISTDAVFDGERGGYTEQDEPHPISAYGESKREGERVVLSEHPGALIVRTNIYGWNAQAKQSLAEWFLGQLRAGAACPGFTDAWFSPILVNDLGDWLLRLLEKGVQGIYHVAGAACLSKFEFGVRLAEAFGLDGTLLRPSRQSDAVDRARRGSRLCLDSGKVADELRRPLPDVAQGLARFRRLEQEGRVETLRSLVSIPEGGLNGGNAA